jgi:hypothetical protein
MLEAYIFDDFFAKNGGQAQAYGSMPGKFAREREAKAFWNHT